MTKRKEDIHDAYRRILERPQLTNEQIDEMREYVVLLAQTICEHVWGKKFY